MMEKKILLADDDPDFIEIHRMILENAGYQVEAVYSSREVLPRLRQEEFGLLILDLMMEKHDTGFGFAKAMKADPTTKDIPILMLTAVGSETGMDFSQALDGCIV